MTITIWHNPRCSKSRETLELIRKKGVEPAIRDYLKQPPSKAEVRGAAYYLVERGLLVMMSNETLEKHALKIGDVYIHITGEGIDMFEALVLSSESRAATRPVGL